MNPRFRCAGNTIRESFIAVVTNRGGGRTRASMPSPSLAICGRAHPLVGQAPQIAQIDLKRRCSIGRYAAAAG